jgi:hypothetical protein
VQQWIELAATAGSLCNLAAAAVNLAATVIKYRRERKSTARETDQRPVDVQGGQSRPLAQGHPEGGQNLRDQVCGTAASDHPTGDELGRDRHSRVARLAAPNPAGPPRKTRR